MARQPGDPRLKRLREVLSRYGYIIDAIYSDPREGGRRYKIRFHHPDKLAHQHRGEMEAVITQVIPEAVFRGFISTDNVLYTWFYQTGLRKIPFKHRSYQSRGGRILPLITKDDEEKEVLPNIDFISREEAEESSLPHVKHIIREMLEGDEE